MNLKKKLSIFIMLCIMVFLVPINAKAATIGKVLNKPEDGWRRYDDNNAKIVYNGTWDSGTLSPYYNQTYHQISNPSSSINFKFYGSKIRIIEVVYTSRATDVQITIDGVNYLYSENASKQYQTLCFEKLDLSSTIHTVKITSLNSNLWFGLDAVDIDETGYLVDINVPVNLAATADNMKVDLSWSAVDGATNYNIKRSNIKGGPYDIISTVSGSAIAYSDNDVRNNNTYYYVVSAIVSGAESPNSNEVSVTPTDSQTITGNAILDIYVDDGTMKEYNLTGDELNDFLTWYDVNGKDNAYYIFIAKGNTAPFKGIKNYIPHNKILYFDVKEYD